MDFPPDEPPEPRRIDKIHDYIDIDDCRDGRLYRVECRNAQWGIYRAERRAFEIVHFEDRPATYIRDEGQAVVHREAGHYNPTHGYHYDIDEPGIRGSAKPLLLINSEEDPDFELLTTLPDARHQTNIKHRFDLERLSDDK